MKEVRLKMSCDYFETSTITIAEYILYEVVQIKLMHRNQLFQNISHIPWIEPSNRITRVKLEIDRVKHFDDGSITPDHVMWKKNKKVEYDYGDLFSEFSTSPSTSDHELVEVDIVVKAAPVSIATAITQASVCFHKANVRVDRISKKGRVWKIDYFVDGKQENQICGVIDPVDPLHSEIAAYVGFASQLAQWETTLAQLPEIVLSDDKTNVRVAQVHIKNYATAQREQGINMQKFVLGKCDKPIVICKYGSQAYRGSSREIDIPKALMKYLKIPVYRWADELGINKLNTHDVEMGSPHAKVWISELIRGMRTYQAEASTKKGAQEVVCYMAALDEAENKNDQIFVNAHEPGSPLYRTVREGVIIKNRGTLSAPDFAISSFCLADDNFLSFPPSYYHLPQLYAGSSTLVPLDGREEDRGVDLEQAADELVRASGCIENGAVIDLYTG